jgi:hypothetical protein
MQYEAPAVIAVADVNEPLIGFIGSGTPTNPQWNEEADES